MAQQAQQPNCDDITDLIPDYAFGLTDEETAARVESALPACPEAARELAEYRELQDAMREDVVQVEPPPALANKLMAAVAASSTRAPIMPRVEPLQAAPYEQMDYRINSARRFPMRASMLVAVAALIALVVTNIYWFLRVDRLSADLQETIGLIAQRDQAMTIADADSLQLAALTGDQNEFAMVMWSEESRKGLIYTRNFPALEAGTTYQLWLARGDERVSCGTFDVDHEGNGAMIFDAPEPIDAFERAGITTEPSGGSADPTGPAVARGTLKESP